jgi:cell division protein FtsA
MRNNMSRSKNGIVASLDVGSSKVCCFIARVDQGPLPRVIGIGQQASRGVKGGVIVDMAAVEGAILNAVHAAEQMAGQTPPGLQRHRRRARHRRPRNWRRRPASCL